MKDFHLNKDYIYHGVYLIITTIYTVFLDNCFCNIICLLFTTIVVWSLILPIVSYSRLWHFIESMFWLSVDSYGGHACQESDAHPIESLLPSFFFNAFLIHVNPSVSVLTPFDDFSSTASRSKFYSIIFK